MPVRTILTTIGFLAVSILGLAAPAGAEVEWRMATEYPETSISGVGLDAFGKAVALRTNGFVKTVNAFDNRMKISSGEMLRAAQDRLVTGADAFAGPLETSDPVFGLPSLPFVVQSVEAAKAVNAQARPLYEKALKARGLKLLYITIWPPTGIWSARPLRDVDSIHELAIRTYDRTSADVMRQAGAKAESLPFNEAIAKLKTHELNAVLSSGDGGAGRKLWTDLPFFTPIVYAVPISIAFMRVEDFEALPKDVQAQVDAAAAETETAQFERLAARTADNYRQMRANGVTIIEPAPPAVIAALKAAAKGPVAAWRAKVTVDAAAIVDAADKR